VTIAGRTLLKFAVKRLQEVVLEPMHRMHDQDKKVLKLQSKVDREKEVCETLKKTVSTVCHNLVLREQELKVLRKRAEEQSIRNKEEVYLPFVYSAMMITSEYRQCIEMIRRMPWG
jgi:hypothetical protein